MALEKILIIICWIRASIIKQSFILFVFKIKKLNTSYDLTLFTLQIIRSVPIPGSQISREQMVKKLIAQSENHTKSDYLWRLRGKFYGRDS